jgi:hypothetical protein
MYGTKRTQITTTTLSLCLACKRSLLIEATVKSPKAKKLVAVQVLFVYHGD